MSPKKERLQNIEFLRIIAMFAIVFYHCIIRSVLNLDNHFELSNSEWSFYHFLKWLIFCHVDIFIIISGYFGIKFSYKKLMIIASQTFIVALVTLTVIPSLFFASTYTPIEIIFKYGFMTILGRGQWFPFQYMQLMLVAPLLNKAILYSSVEEKKTYLLNISIIVVVINGFIKSSEGMDLIDLAFMYIIGGCIKDLDIFKNVKTRFLLLFFMLNACACFLLESVTWWRWIGYGNPLIIINAVIAFVVFSRLNINFPVISKISSGCFIVYLLHDHAMSSRILVQNISSTIFVAYNSPIVHFLLILILSLSIFILGILFSKLLNIFIYKPVDHLITG